jgi:hypothetical protein
MVDYLGRSLDYDGVFRSSCRSSASHTLDFIKDYPVKTLAELQNDPQLGIFVVNARICGIVNFDPWWYPICDCPRIYQKYLGSFHCTKCSASKFIASPKYWLNFIVKCICESKYLCHSDDIYLCCAFFPLGSN